MRFLVIDTETVGFKPFDHGGGVCEISVREVDENFNTLAHHYSLVDPEGPISPSASGVHGIRDSDVVDAPTMIEWLGIVLEENIFGDGCEPFYFIAHNSAFDLKFLKPYIACDFKEVDSLRLAKRYYPDSPDHKLTTLAVVHDLQGFSASEAHGAGQDTLVLLELMKQLSLDTGLSLAELCEDAQRKDPITKFPFGKHKGKLITEVVKEDRRYIDWALKNLTDMQPDLREALTAAIGH